ncbi:hypothetical protein BDV25DRAFT_157991 [Aspergillus avenaceus]|uniref:Uncharacterized protein n=1 Tax=Aspergillus avenaceus TaxID=36643 RepID=A0A5N6TQE8_ASPAV|nr:hypothetical protein BDV25DRAFT_157991 [Aspergillus avenaceus]
MRPSASSSHPRAPSPSSMNNLRHRGPARAATFTEGNLSNLQSQRRNSTISDSISEARHTIRSSTDDLFFPRVAKGSHDIADLPNEESHWHSAPLGLALLPAIAGIFFKDGSAFVTDFTLLVLAAIFLNWSVRLPWDWYRSAQAIRQDRFYDAEEAQLDIEIDHGETPEELKDSTPGAKGKSRATDADAASAATKELQIHELAALASCFIFPAIGTWLLHTIRFSLSRPSEGLVSNYNLTVFLVAAEIRPFAHLLRMVQARTLHLQRIVATSTDVPKDKIDAHRILDIAKRLEELEAHVAETAVSSQASDLSQSQGQDQTKNIVSQTTSDVRNSIQPDIEALNRAVRRYEKRTAVASIQTDARLHALETHVRDAMALAAAAQRSSVERSRGLTSVLFEWCYAGALLPIQIIMSLVNLPSRLMNRSLQYFKGMFFPKKLPKSRKGKELQYGEPRPHRKSKQAPQPDSIGDKGSKSAHKHT